MRVDMNQLMTSVALGARSISALTLPVWSTSSWLMNTQRMSSGSTRPKTSARNRSRFSAIPVSTTTGSAPRITSVLIGTKTGAVPSPSWSWMRNVSCAISVGSRWVLVIRAWRYLFCRCWFGIGARREGLGGGLRDGGQVGPHPLGADLAAGELEDVEDPEGHVPAPAGEAEEAGVVDLAGPSLSSTRKSSPYQRATGSTPSPSQAAKSSS